LRLCVVDDWDPEIESEDMRYLLSNVYAVIIEFNDNSM